MSRETCIPHDLIIEILSRLPPKSLIRFRCVCKSWCALIHDRRFQDHHNSNYSKNAIVHWVGAQAPSLDNYDSPMKYQVFDETFSSSQYPFDEEHDIGGGIWHNSYIVGSCKGLICVCHDREPGYSAQPPYSVKMSLWNPSTRTHKELELLTSIYYPVDYMLGFGFSSKDNDHKVVIILENRQDNQNNVHIYSVTNNSWSEIQSKPTTPWRNPSCYSTYLNGACYWVCQIDERKWNRRILCFNFDNNNFDNIDLPLCTRWSRTFVFKDTLGVWEERERTIWIMKDDDGCSKSWTCLLKVTKYDRVAGFDPWVVFGSTMDGRLLYYTAGKKKAFMAYDPETRQTEELVPASEDITTLIAYEPSLFLL